MKSPIDREIVFSFGSHPTKDLTWRWAARLVFPPGATAETVLKIHLVDGYAAPIAEGVFEFAGSRLPVRNGLAEITYADFVRGKHEVPLWMHRPGIEPIPGGLTFE